MRILKNHKNPKKSVYHLIPQKQLKNRILLIYNFLNLRMKKYNILKINTLIL